MTLFWKQSEHVREIFSYVKKSKHGFDLYADMILVKQFFRKPVWSIKFYKNKLSRFGFMRMESEKLAREFVETFADLQEKR